MRQSDGLRFLAAKKAKAGHTLASTCTYLDQDLAGYIAIVEILFHQGRLTEFWIAKASSSR